MARLRSENQSPSPDFMKMCNGRRRGAQEKYIHLKKIDQNMKNKNCLKIYPVITTKWGENVTRYDAVNREKNIFLRWLNLNIEKINQIKG